MKIDISKNEMIDLYDMRIKKKKIEITMNRDKYKNKNIDLNKELGEIRKQKKDFLEKNK